MIETNVNRVAYDGNGTTVDFSFPSTVLKDTDVKVIFRSVSTVTYGELTLGTHYEIQGVLDSAGRYNNGVTVHLLFTMLVGQDIVIYQDPVIKQLVDLTDNGLLPVETQVELPLDRLTVIAQRLTSRLSRVLRQPEEDNIDVPALPRIADRASKYLAFDSSGNPIAAVGTSATLQPVSAFIDTLLDDADAAAARTTLGLPTPGKGSVIGGRVDGTFADVPSNGNNGQILTTNSQISTGMFWELPDQLNPLVNGLGEVWQDGTTFAAIANGAYCADMWRWDQVGAGVVTVRQSTNVPAVILNNMFYQYSIEVDVTTADASIAAGDTYSLVTFIEGYDWRYFAQRLARLSFLVMAPKTGVYPVALANSGGDRYFIGTYTINVANTWEFKSITLGASPSAGTWDYTSGLGASIRFPLAAGSNFVGVTGGWQAGSPLWTTGSQPNAMDNTANFFRICDVRMFHGTTDSFPRFTPFSQQLARCQRYYQKSFAYGTAPAQNTGSNVGALSYPSPVAVATFNGAQVRLPVRMRTAPSITTYNPKAANAQMRNEPLTSDCSGTATGNLTDDSFVVSATTPASTVAGQQLTVHWMANARF